MLTKLLPFNKLVALATLRVSLDNAMDAIGENASMHLLLMSVASLFRPESLVAAGDATSYVFGTVGRALMLLKSVGSGETVFAEASVRKTDTLRVGDEPVAVSVCF